MKIKRIFLPAFILKISTRHLRSVNCSLVKLDVLWIKFIGGLLKLARRRRKWVCLNDELNCCSWIGPLSLTEVFTCIYLFSSRTFWHFLVSKLNFQVISAWCSSSILSKICILLLLRNRIFPKKREYLNHKFQYGLCMKGERQNRGRKINFRFFFIALYCTGFVGPIWYTVSIYSNTTTELR